ncbi:hypothetical protein BOTBODRAFT_305749 [Botryobasidium botryosum FD-172 SS1]|uniref:Uncharacterized protein n=1 Tax=Botryobasidium botryosum (strain FD-172 SS1) TaxID=930990 RepID=A0A067N0D1_BOTB1|nr:hypothetical protein BOTBODRAFT_305749 [Botryobasidium botryosum FD-172 SS1]
MSDTAQVILGVTQDFFKPNHGLKKFYTNTLLIPVYLAGVSILLLLFKLASQPAQKLYYRISGAEIPNLSTGDNEADVEPRSSQDTGFFPELRASIKSQGGYTIFTYKILRLLSSLALLGITITAFIIITEHDEQDRELHGDWVDIFGRKRRGRHGKKRHGWFTSAEWHELALCTFFTYTSLLALLSVTLQQQMRRTTNRHLVLLLFAAFGVFAYRDIWPLATFGGVSQDAAAGWLTWSRVSILGLAGVIIPLIIPHEHIPVDPRNPREPNPEQTASYLSFLMFDFLNPTMFKAYRRPSDFSYDSLPVLADYDESHLLVSKHLSVLDPMQQGGKQTHLFWGLMKIFRWEYSWLTFLVITRAISTFAAPLGINRLLDYVETGGKGAIIRPWVWVSWLFIGPMIASVCMNTYIFTTTRMLVRVECILTELIFEHALKIRMKADGDSGAKSGVSTTVSTPRTEPADLPTDGEAPAAASEGGSTAVASSNDSPKSATKPPAAPAVGAKPAESDPSSNLVGRINNLMSTDLGNITDARDFLFVLTAVLQIFISAAFLYIILGWCALVGIGFMVISIPLPGKIAQLVNNVQKERMKRTDGRVQAVTESLNVVRMIKLFGWEDKVYKRIKGQRDDEIKWMKKRNLLLLLNMNINYLLPLITMVLTFATFTLIMKQDLTASKVFSAMAIFDLLRDQLHGVFWIIPMVIQGKVSLDRVNDFIYNTELLDEHVNPENETIRQGFAAPTADPTAIGFSDAVFTWANQVPGTPTPSRRNFRLRIEGDLFFQRGKISLIVGPTGSGKTSLLLALLGEMHFAATGPGSSFNLPREGGISYAAQEAWVQNETIRDNILFGQQYDEERYKKVIFQCGLERDLELFDAGDRTEVGEKGMTLSGGQKARVSLARAIYSKAKIILLDDVLSALDVHTSRWIVDKCFCGDLVEGRTLILVTHNVAMVSPISHFVVSLGLDGRVVSQGSIADALSKNSALRAEVARTSKEEQLEEQVAAVEGMKKEEAPKPSGKLMTAEEKAIGRVRWSALKLFFMSLGGLGFWLSYGIGIFVCDLITVIQTWFLGYWAKQYEEPTAGEVYVPYYLTVYCLFLLAGSITYSSSFFVYMVGTLRASRRIHNKLVASVLGTTLRWLDSTPIGRVISRFTQDMRAVDGPIVSSLQDVMELSVALLLKFAAVVYMSPIFAIPGAIVAILGGWFGEVYIAAQLPIKREMSNARSPVFSHFGAAIAGLTSIRAYGAQDAFKEESLKRIDKYTRPARSFYNANRWIGVRMDILGSLFTAALGAYLVYGTRLENASNIGFSLSMAASFSSMILWWVRVANDFEVQANSLERIQDYLAIEQEPKPTADGEPPAYWPATGNLRVEGLSARYSVDGPDVLHDVSFEVKSGERVGVVGRTGSGKSSLTLSLLRMIPTTGTVYYDNVATNSLNLGALRSSITIIPQQPELLSGTLRQNLDPFDEHDDAELNDALRAAGLENIQSDDPEDKITLETNVGSGGGNFSLGQRQIIALARAIVRRSKVLILDEATAAIDFETDTWIQNTIRQGLKGTTLITVAHRLQTVIDADRILVLDAGKLIEFDSPAALLTKDGGYFKALVDQSGDRESLYEAAGLAAGSKQK